MAIVDEIKSNVNKTIDSVVSSVTTPLGLGIPMRSYPLSLNQRAYDYQPNPHSSCLMFHITQSKPTSKGDLTGKSLKVRQDDFLKSPANTGTLGMIQMYMPAMMENTKHNYASDDTTIWDDAIQAMGVAAKSGAQEGLKKGVSLGTDRVVQHIANTGAVVRKTGQIHKQRQSMLYGGTEMRSHTFLFTMRARNLPELQEIGEIIHMFRKYSSGSRSSVANTSLISDNETAKDVVSSFDTFGTVDAPPIWYVEERVNDTSRPRFVDKFYFGPAVVTNVRVNKSPDQVYQTLAQTGGDPVEIELEVQMQEMIPVYSDYWDTVRAKTYNL